MARLKLIAEPTFPAKVEIPLAGGATADVSLTFKHRTRKQLDDYVNSRSGKTDVESFMDIVVGWDLEDEFNAANVELLLENHISVALAVYRAYLAELVGAREKNS